jgi:hypothetical protein
MSEWIDDLATVCEEEPLTEPETEGLLRIAREVAHRVERKATPLATFLLGIQVAQRMTNGTPRSTALAEGIGMIEGLLPSSSEDR